MNQKDFETLLKYLLKSSLRSAKFEDVKPVVELFLYSDYLPTTVENLKPLEKKRLLFLVEKFRRYSCSSITRRQQLKAFAEKLNTDHSNPPLQVSEFVDPLAKKLGLDEDLNHLKSQLLTLQTRHYHFQ